MNTISFRRRAIWIAVVALIILIAVTSWGLNHKVLAADNKRAPAGAIAVKATTTTVKQQNVPIYRTGSER